MDKTIWVMGTAMMLCLAGCARQQIADERVLTTELPEAGVLSGEDELLRIYTDSLRSAHENGLRGTEKLRYIIGCFGEHGYTAVDSGNQIDMTCPQQAIRFCESADAGKTADLTLIEVTLRDGFIRHDLSARDGQVDVARSCYACQDGIVEKTASGSYTASRCAYTEDGYLMLAGTSYSQQQYVLSLSSAEEYAAFRVEPLDERCRELNREYLMPVGYAQSNMLLTEWDGQDLGGLDLYDCYDLFYPMCYGQALPYRADEDISVGAVYQIPEDAFEEVLLKYLAVEPSALQQKADYDPVDAAYSYRPRGFYEVGCTDYPYPEVVAHKENGDGTITLTVHAVFPYEGLSDVLAHEVVVRPVEGGVQYVSNHILPSSGEHRADWYTPRLTLEEWEEIYAGGGAQAGGMDQGLSEYLAWLLPQAQDCLLTEEEKAGLQEQALSAAAQVKDVYQDVEIAGGASYASNIRTFTPGQREEAARLLGLAGYTSIAQDCDMAHPEKIREAYAAYLDGQDAQFTVFEVGQDGLIAMITFVCRAGRIQTFYVGIGWQEGGVPVLKNALVSDVSKLLLTEKGYLIYAYEEAPDYAGAKQYWRIEPLPAGCRELTREYISGLSYVDYTMLATDWDSSNVTDILMPCMFQDLYRIDTGEAFYPEAGRIDAQMYERIMTTYLPVPVDRLREICGYDEHSDSYPYEMILSVPYPPFGEVVSYVEDADGTITLTVDCVWPEYDCDLAYTNTIVVQPFSDGTFRYLSNSIEERGKTRADIFLSTGEMSEYSEKTIHID